ncbi:stage II sporulation protein M [Paenibacillus baekrokdamisoli]|uniref:Stage II sporulation protein M n=1 Tax=Paenibacillus baekrokdamisoli TaxID=1712516 RepID=A0A3G9JDJ4_9BACL|nr:stage II sporulation protein M [Paenibacillus baekrokdamisoli]MBB3069575.1 stage II sporulation protein M [Paenibacillus baekrokdamisoli]BBH21069.1 stage II sporulation protein M [Paenibacillus baekrokdamisoli]
MRSPMQQSLLKDQMTLYVFVSVLFAVGVVFGALLVNALTLGQQQDLVGDVQLFVQHVQDGVLQGGSPTFWERTLFHAKWILLIGVLGMTVVGMPLVLVLDFMKGVLVGFAIGTLVSQHAWKGLLFSLVSIAPPNMIIVPALLIASVSSVSFSIYIVKNRFLSRYGSLSHPFVAHSSTVVLMLLIIIGAAMIESFVSPLLIKWAAPLIAGATNEL